MTCELPLNKAITHKNLNQCRNIHDEQYIKILNEVRISITDFSFCLGPSVAWQSPMFLYSLKF